MLTVEDLQQELTCSINIKHRFVVTLTMLCSLSTFRKYVEFADDFCIPLVLHLRSVWSRCFFSCNMEGGCMKCIDIHDLS